jgi:3-oxoacyl-[acyl-carrier-protein] synthase-1
VPASNVAIVYGGLVCGVGLNAPSSLAAIRCAISDFHDTTYFDARGEPVAGSGVPLPRPWRGRIRLRKMLAMAVLECLEHLDADISTIPLLLCVAEHERPGRVDGLDEVLRSELEAEIGVTFHRAYSGTIAQGRVGTAYALAQARALIGERNVPGVVIAGVDNLLGRQTLRSLETRDRLRTSENSNGLIPGEAAAAVFVERAGRSPGQLVCTGVGYGMESATVDGEDPLRAQGLVRAVNAALDDAHCSLADLDFRITDNAGEQYYFKEDALAMARTLRTTKAEFDIWHPADCIGEVGAAIGSVILNVALMAVRKGYAAGPGILCHLGNDAGERGVFVLRFQ